MSKRSRSRGKGSASPTTTRSNTRERFQSQTIPIIFIALVAFVAYANAWPNNLVWDDVIFSMENRVSAVSLAEIGSFFTSDVWAAFGKDTGLYRPLLLLSVALDIQVFGEWVAGYHLVNILLHVLVSITVFGFIRYLLLINGGRDQLSAMIAMFSALLFAVHPIHAEVVNSIFNRSDMLVTLGVVGGLWWFMPAVERYPVKAWAVMSLVYLLVMLCKETGIILPALVVATLWVTSSDDWLARLRKCAPVLCLLIPLGLYFLMRMHALDSMVTIDDELMNDLAGASDDSAGGGVGSLVRLDRLGLAVAVWFDSIKLVLWPNRLLALHPNSDTNVWMALAAQGILLALALMLYRRKSPGLLLGLAFFYFLILPASRLVGGGPGPHLAERYIYAPSVGITIAFAFGLYWLARRYSLRAVAILTLSAGLVLTPLTWSRNADWATSLTLAESDYERGKQYGKTLRTLISELLRDGQKTRAARICDENFSEFNYRWFLAVKCGEAYQSLKRYNKAESAYLQALNREEGRASAHYSLAIMYLGLDRRTDANEQFELAIEEELEAFMKEYLAAERLIRLFPSDRSKLLEAAAHLEKTIELAPQFLLAQQRREELDQKLQTFRND